MNRSVWVLSTAGLVRGMGRAATWIFLPLVLLTYYSLTYFQIGLLIAAIIPVSVFSNFLSGFVGDRYGRRYVAIVPSFFNSVIMAAIFLAVRGGVLPLMLLWGVGEFSTDMALPAQDAMVGDVSGGELTARAYSLRRIFSNAGFAISPALGGFLAESHGLGIVYAVASVTNLCEGLILLVFLKESFHGIRRKSSLARDILFPFRDTDFLKLLVVIAGLTILSDQFGSTLTLFLGGVQKIQYFQMGLVYSVNGILVVILQPAVTRITGRRGTLAGWLASGSIIYGLGYITLLAGSLPFYFAAMAVITLGENIVTPSQLALVSESAMEERRAAYFGGYNATGNAGKVVAPLIGTIILGLGSVGPAILWGGMFVLALVVAAGFNTIRNANSARLSVH